MVWLKRGTRLDILNQECPPRFPNPRVRRSTVTVMIGIDPHKGSHTAVALDEAEVELAQLKVRAGKGQSA